MCDVSNPGCFCLSESFFFFAQCGRACVSKIRLRILYLHITASPVKPVSIALGGWRLRLFNFSFAPRWAGALQTPTNVSSAGYFTGNTLLLNLHFPKCLNPYHHQTHSPSTPRAQSERNESLESHSWTKVMRECDAQGFYFLSFFFIYICCFFWLPKLKHPPSL